jgi:ubiquinone biosynthesis protein UbiJ
MLLERLEAVLNRNVAESRRAQALARQLDGRVMSLTVEGTPLAFYFRADGGRLSLASSPEGAADASLSGTPICW